MPRFIAIYYQKSGCDHTIGCGVKVDRFAASKLDAAVLNVAEALAKTGDDAEFSDEEVKSIHKVDVYEIAAHVSLGPDVWTFARRAAQEKAAQEKAEAKERAELDRLKRKYEK